MKSFAQLKKDLKVGVKIKTIQNSYKPEKNGEIRVVGKVQTNAIAFTTTEGKLSYLWWPKASEVEYEGNVFKIYSEPHQYNNHTRTLEFIYEVI